jgi:hypothetical protein
MVGIVQQHGQQFQAVFIICEVLCQGDKAPHAFDFELIPVTQACFQLTDQALGD